MRKETVTTTIIHDAPGNGTQYRIFVSPNPWGGFNWVWVPEARILAGGWAATRVGGELSVTVGKLGRVDRDAIRSIVDVVRSNAASPTEQE